MAHKTGDWVSKSSAVSRCGRATLSFASAVPASSPASMLAWAGITQFLPRLTAMSSLKPFETAGSALVSCQNVRK